MEKGKHNRHHDRILTQLNDLANEEAPASPVRIAGERKKSNILTPHPHALQHVLSYPALLDNDKARRPKVYVIRKGKRVLCRYGSDMFRKANIRSKRPLIVIRQHSDTGDVTVSSVESDDWLQVLKDKRHSLGSDGDTLHVVPAGSFSYRRSTFGFMVRSLLALHSSYASSLKLCGHIEPPVRVAAVVIPQVIYKGKPHLIITQRRKKKKHGTYNGMYVFPGGHVEADETLEQGAVREFQEETGLEVDYDSVKLRACWQEVLPAKKLQFLMLVYSADVVPNVNSESGEFEWSDLELQKDEVETLALIPEHLWEGVSVRADIDGELEAVVVQDGKIVHTKVSANDVTGHGAGFGVGIGSGHRYALMQYLKPFDKHIVLEKPSSRSSEHSISSSIRSSITGSKKRISKSSEDVANAIHLADAQADASVHSYKEGDDVVLDRGMDEFRNSAEHSSRGNRSSAKTKFSSSLRGKHASAKLRSIRVASTGEILSVSPRSILDTPGQTVVNVTDVSELKL